MYYEIYHVGGINHDAPELHFPFWEMASALLFDAQTGEAVPYTALLTDGWEAQSVWVQMHAHDPFREERETMAQAPDLTGAMLRYVRPCDGGVEISWRTGDPAAPFVYAIVPETAINW